MPQERFRRSPFPGMDPYLEAHWEDLHGRFIAYAADALEPQLADDLIVRMEERVYVDEGPIAESARKPDIQVVESPVPWEARESVAASTGIAVPVILTYERDPILERYLQIVDLAGNRVVTTIEFLSPTNKLPGAGRDAYLRKRDEFIDGGVNLVEVDLVRTGDWKRLLGTFTVPEPYVTTYRAMLRRAAAGQQIEFFPVRLRDRLPILPVPLRPGEADAALNLQEVFEQAYRRGRYDRTDYTIACEPPLEGEDREWAEELLKQAVFRK